jgi:hypothetical protein
MENLSLFEKLVKMVDKYGWFKILQTILFIGLFLFVIYYIPAKTKTTVQKTTIETLELVAKNKEVEHLKGVERRREMQPQIEAILKTLLKNCKADRAFIIELHNGSNNINGVPFLHGSVTYDAAVEGMEIIDEEYQNLSLSRFEMSTYLHNNLNFIGNIDEIKQIDKKIGTKLASNEVKYLAVSTLYDGSKEWGWFGVLYNRDNDIPQEKDILNYLLITSQSLTKEMKVLKEPK